MENNFQNSVAFSYFLVSCKIYIYFFFGYFALKVKLPAGQGRHPSQNIRPYVPFEQGVQFCMRNVFLVQMNPAYSKPDLMSFPG